ncbi:hypothetical protein Pan216_31390 [Planctomycetes bacterium Pan216]|uniref:Thiol:disulfide interchange protein DsbD n=1 Tax=Kolteria novifilia TaxID=2527975 RepID=A0A518B5Q2_9BACT|nr:hypothetical protein Pan216_31390 [Planctomycetes bacterium Pan216]
MSGRVRWALGAIVVILVGSGQAMTRARAEELPPTKDQPRNRLGESTSAYLRSHADNPVHWYPWGEDAFDEARKQKKPIFLSIGYNACHWCHVMNRESFANPEIAKILNDHFIAIKVDREELPEVDKTYLRAVEAMRGTGGWPLTVFLMPDRRPFFGGTYFPPGDRIVPESGRVMAGLPTVLRQVSKLYREQPAQVNKMANAVADFLRNSIKPGAMESSKLTPELLASAATSITSQFDPEYAGIGRPPRYAPKFPQPSVPLFLLAYDDKPLTADSPVVKQADIMIRNGLFDHLGGGFHRYCVDREWIVPHFEKMLYDQGQLLSLYSKLQPRHDRPGYARAVAETVAFLERDMLLENGLYASSLDAESEHEEGKYYVWTEEELRTSLGDEADWVIRFLGAEQPNFEEKSILVEAVPPEKMAESLGESEADFLTRWDKARRKLLAVREERASPRRDDKAITAWNALVAIGLADAAEAFNDQGYREKAVRTVEAILQHLRRKEGTLARFSVGGEAKGTGYADDYAATILALLAVDRVTEDSRYLETATQLAESLIKQFWDQAGSGVFYAASTKEPVIIRIKENYDGAYPSSNSLTALALVTLAKRLDDSGEEKSAVLAGLFRERAVKTMGIHVATMEETPVSSTTMLRAVDRYLKEKGASPVSKDGPIESLTILPAEPELVAGKEVRLTLRVEMAEGWHVNANPSTAPFLKPTVVTLAKDSPAVLKDVSYPKGEAVSVGTEANERIDVFSGTFDVTVAVVLAKEYQAGQPLEFHLAYQACDDRRCLAPATATVAVPSSADSPDKRPEPPRDPS